MRLPSPASSYRVVALLVALPVCIAAAQSDTARVDSSQAWVTKRQGFFGAAAVAATVGLGQWDMRIANHLQRSRWQRDKDVRNTALTFAFLGGPGPFLIGTGLMAVGSATGSSVEMGAGRRITESVLLAASITAVGKGLFGRALPGVPTEHRFEFARGFHRRNGKYVAFPSGHTAAGFALAQSIVSETDRISPDMVRFVAPTAYITATGIGVARLYQHVHWASDLPIAAAIGLWSGMTVESRSHEAKRSTARVIADGISVAPMADHRVLLSWSNRFANR